MEDGQWGEMAALLNYFLSAPNPQFYTLDALATFYKLFFPFAN